MAKFKLLLAAKARLLIRFVIVATLLVESCSWALSSAGSANAESFVNNVFQQQWAATDQAVAAGKVSRTFFWGLQPFAHTAEVYSEALSGTREVQYFDKGRMELTKRAGQDPNQVTNGLLTVELVSGQMQIGDTTFITRGTSTTPVAGDSPGPNTNAATPTYASFNQGKLAFGVADAITNTDRTGQTVTEAVDNNGVVSTLSQTAATVKYADYVPQTNHNIADVFYNFFQIAPLGADKWLPVMGYPITEPFWIKNKVTVAGQPRDVLVQLFQRRTLTYTPANPAGFQVEMGNIGQHYYTWRYNINPADVLPGNFRLILPQSKSLYSYSIYHNDSFKLGDFSDYIKAVYPSKHGKAVVTTAPNSGDGATKVYLDDLAHPNEFQALPLPSSMRITDIRDVSWSDDGSRFVLSLYGTSTKQEDITVSEVYTVNSGKASILKETNYGVALSPNGQYLAYFDINTANPQALEVNVLNLDSNTSQHFTIPNQSTVGSVSWLGNSSSRLFIQVYENSSSQAASKIFVLDIVSGTFTTIASDVSNLSLSPNGKYFAYLIQSSNGSSLNVYSVDDPQTPVIPSNSNFSGEIKWGSDGSYLFLTQETYLDSGIFQTVTPISLATGSPIEFHTELNGGGTDDFAPLWVAPYYTVGEYYNQFTSRYEGVKIMNLDGSDEKVLTKDGDVSDAVLVQVAP